MDEPYRSTPTFQRGLELLDEDPFPRLGEGTRYQQPAIFLCSVCAWESQREDLAPIAAAGHSLGEYAAMVAARALRFEDAIGLVAERGAAMADAGAAAAGGMTAMLGGDSQAIRALAQELGLVVANDNAPGQLVLSGPRPALEALAERAREETGARARPLDVAGAFHSPMMAPAAARLQAALARVSVAPLRFPVYSNGSARPFVDVRGELAENLLSPVRWRETVLALNELGVDQFIELGPGEALSAMVKRILPSIEAVA
jgi:[acyl-carrier-protein] S-malonyltransferase